MGKWRYGVILDAGSSGTRLHIYRWLDSVIARQEANENQLHSLPSLETHGQWTRKTHPGVSSFSETPGLIGPNHLGPLLEHALKIIPEHSVKSTPIFLLATAGVRLLPDLQKNELLNEICLYIQTYSQFLLPDCSIHIQAIPGETEGLYGWIAANYLLGGFDAPEEHNHGKGHHTYGFLDMGGASAQIAFAPNSTEAEKHANDLKLLRLRTIDGRVAEYRVFVTTWLGFGVNEARKRFIAGIMQASGEGVLEIPNPCLPKGVKTRLDGASLSDPASLPAGEHYLLGTGKFDECLRATYPLLDKDAPCEDQPCLLHGVHVPAIDFDVNHFIGISEYWHTTHEIFEASHEDKAYDFNTYQERVNAFCQREWASIQADVAVQKWGKKVDEQTASEVCFKASWLINMLHDGIGIPRINLEKTSDSDNNGTKEVTEHGAEKLFLEPFQAVNKIKHTEVSWTLGKMVLYAASQVEPLDDDSLPVGFGSNTPGIPIDFQYPAGPTYLGSSNSSIPSEAEDVSLAESIHRTLFDSDSRRRIPGFLLFLLILFIAGFYICGRNRRAKLYRHLLGSPGQRRRRFAAKLPFLFRGSNPHYERVLEDGHGLEDPNDFELSDVDSEDSPKKKKKKSRGGMLNSEFMDRSGLVVRTESRERLALHNGRKSRTGSPARLKSSLTALAEQR